jgi:hypothetical protein
MLAKLTAKCLQMAHKTTCENTYKTARNTNNEFARSPARKYARKNASKTSPFLL